MVSGGFFLFFSITSWFPGGAPRCTLWRVDVVTAEVVALVGVASEDLSCVICALPLDEIVSVVRCSSDALYFFNFVFTLVLLAGIAPSGLVYQQAFIAGKAPATVALVLEVMLRNFCLRHVCLIARP